jgi:hypothetical protein
MWLWCSRDGATTERIQKGNPHCSVIR